MGAISLEARPRLVDASFENVMAVLQGENYRPAEIWSFVSMAAKLPTIDPASLRPKGEWIPSESDFDDDDTLFDVEEWCDWQCTVCHEDICYEDPMERRWLPNFCPNCGADMRGST